MRKEQWMSLVHSAGEKLAKMPAMLRGYTGKLPKVQKVVKERMVTLARSVRLPKVSRPQLPELPAVPEKLRVIPQRCLRCVHTAKARVNRIPKQVKFVTLGVVMAVIIATAVGVQAHVDSFTYVVYVDGEEVGYVAEETIIPEYLVELDTVEAAQRGMDVVARQTVEVVREQRKGITVDTDTVKAYLAETMEYDVYAYVIMVNDVATLAVQSYEDYELVIDELKSAYISGKDNAVIQAIVLNDKVEARRSLVEPGELYAAETAATILLRGTDRREIYLVSRGDSLWTIARANSMTVSEIQEANPQLAGSDSIRPGDELNLVVSEPLVTVSITEDVVIEQRIPFETEYKNDNTIYRGNTKVLEPGQHGKKEVTVRITRVNGVEQEREVIGEAVVQEPVRALVARGTAPVPTPTGTGRFLWPVSGGGTITSRFGPRGRGFHNGVDIASSRGTPVLAADSGVVTQSGWSGGYGNMVTIDHGNGYVTRYAHNSANLVSVGVRVSRGQQIARMGSTGNSTGNHVHFEVLRSGSFVNPMQFY